MNRSSKSAAIYEIAKRGLDFAIALLSVIVLSPVLLLIAIAIKIDSKGPVFFKQERLGKGTRRFTMIKFRSMYLDGDARIGELAALNEALPGRCSRCAATPVSRASAACCAAPAWTSCLSCSTSWPAP